MGRGGRCCFSYCCHRRGIEKCSFVRFPKDIERCRKWIQVTGDQDLLYLPMDCITLRRYVCGCHFKDDDYRSKKRKRLKKCAIPSIFNSKIIPLTDEEILEYPLTNQILVSCDTKIVPFSNITNGNIRQTPRNVDVTVSEDVCSSQTLVNADNLH